MLHPCFHADDELLAQCETIRQRRSGPGGQHRNKVETAIRLLHKTTGLTAQASERRSQADNLKQALFRLRLELAIHHRTERDLDQLSKQLEKSEMWKKRRRGGKISINSVHLDYPAMLADVMDCLSVVDWDHRQAAEILQLSSSQLIKFLKREPRSLSLLNQQRQMVGLNPLS
ncbi:MAG: peptide chain release factor-like protein [Planctomycetaceae bacterium]|nr:peptide chain release factor-like protein [Planctomycetaceae bacterium]